MRKFGSLFTQNLKVTLRSGFHYIIIGLAVLFILLTHFVIPEELNTTPEEFFLDNTQNRVFETFLVQEGADEGIFYDDVESFKKAISDNRGSIGIIVSGADGEYEFEILTRGRIAEGTENLIIAGLESITAFINGEAVTTNIEYAFLREPAAPVPFNKSLLPVFITFEVIMLGFILIAVLVFQEKQEGSIRSYRISASGTFQYMVSKSAVITVMGLLYGFFSTVFIVGFKADYLILMLMILLASLFINLLGLGLSVFFRNISEFIIVSLVVLTLVQLPLISYFNPTFSPEYLRWIPSYSVIFGVREAIFPTGKENFFLPLFAILLVEIVVVFGFCYWAVRVKLMRSGGRM